MLKNGTPPSPATARASSVLPGAGRANQQHTPGDARPERDELLWLLQELDDLLQFLARFFHPSHVEERNGRQGILDRARATATKGHHGVAAAVTHSAPGKEHDAAEEHQRPEGQQHADPGRGRIGDRVLDVGELVRRDAEGRQHLQHRLGPTSVEAQDLAGARPGDVRRLR